MSASWTPIPEGAEATPDLFNSRFEALHKGNVFNVKAYGALGDAATDDVTAIQLAIDDALDAGGGVVFFPSGTYLLASKPQEANAIFNVGNNLTIDMRAATLKIADNMDDWDVFRALPPGSLEDFTILGGIYDGNGANNLLPEDHSAITQALLYVEGEGTKRVLVDGVRFRNVAGQRCIALGHDSDSIHVQDVSITNCDFHNCGAGLSGNSEIASHSSIWIHGLRVNISNCTFHVDSGIADVNTAIEIHGSSHTIADNRVWSYGIGVIFTSLLSDHLSCTYSNNSMRNVLCGYRAYAATGNEMEFAIEGGVISQGLDTFPLIDLGFAEEPIRLGVIRGITLDYLAASPTGSDGHGIGLGRCDNLIIEGVTGNRLSGNLMRRSVSSPDLAGWEANQLRLSIKNCRAIDCGLSVPATADATLHYAIYLQSANSLKSVLIDGLEVTNTAGSNSPMTHVYVQDCNVTGDLTLRRFDVTDGIEDRPIIAADDTISGFLLVQLEGRGDPDDSVRASDGSTWLDKDSGTGYVKAGGGNDSSGWA